MGDHLELLVNRLLTEQTLAATIQSINQAKTEHDLSPMADLEGGFSPEKKENNESQRSSTGKLVECRICQDEDEDTNMETPCSCSGSLKYAHRKCIQKWCNEKGDTVCEICLQHFKPGYTAPPKLFRYGNIPENFRGNWEVSTHEINNHQFITMIQRDDDLLDSENNDDSVSTSRGLFYCRLVAAIALALLFLRHVLAIIPTEVEQYSFTLVTMLALKTVAFFLPLYVMLGKVIAFPRRHLLLGTQESPTDTAASEEENENTQTTQPRLHVIQIR